MRKILRSCVGRKNSFQRLIAAASGFALESLEERILFGLIPASCPDGTCPRLPRGGKPIGGIDMDKYANGGNPGLPDFTAAPIRYSDGTVKIQSTDLSSSGFGSDWGYTRSWTNRRGRVEGFFDAPLVDQPGNYWMVTQLPKIIHGEDGYHISGFYALTNSATDFRFFSETVNNGSSSNYDSFIATPETMIYDRSGSTDDLTVVDSSGNQLFLPNLQPNGSATLSTLTDPGGRVTHISRSSNRITEMYREETVGGQTVRESYVMGYNSAAGSSAWDYAIPQTVSLQRKVGSASPTTIRTVEYDYYDGITDTGNGSIGDLRSATVKDANGNIINTDYYRYYTDNTYVTRGGQSVLIGKQYDMKFVVSGAAFDRLVADAGSRSAAFGASDTDVALYANNYFEYDTSRRVALETAQGQGCSVCTSGQGTFTYTYQTTGYGLLPTDQFNTATFNTIETLPDGNQNIVYSSEVGAPVLKIYKDVSSGMEWRSYWRYDDHGRVILMAEPSAVDNSFDPDYSTDDIIGYNSSTGDFEHLHDEQGLIHRYSYYDDTTAGDEDLSESPGGVNGYLYQESIQHGDGGGNLSGVILQSEYAYWMHSGGGATVYPLAYAMNYSGDGGAGAEITSYAYTWFTDTVRASSTTVTYPPLSDVEQNGNGAGDVEATYFDIDGNPIWFKDGGGYLTHMIYDVTTGALLSKTVDAPAETGGPTRGWGTSLPTALNLTTQMDADLLGRTIKLTDPNNNINYTVYNDAQHEVRTYPGWHQVPSTSTWTTTGPVSVSREYRAGTPDTDKVGAVYTESLTFALSPISSDEPDGSETISASNIQSLSRGLTNNAGQLVEVDAYFSLAGITYSQSTIRLGSNSNDASSGNRHATKYRYDDRGRRNRVEESTETITRTVYDGLGRVSTVWIGTDDVPTSGYWSPGNNAGANMGKVNEYVYDEGGVGDGNLTEIIQHVQYIGTAAGSGNLDRHTHNYYDWRNRLIATKQGQTGKQRDVLTVGGTIETDDEFILTMYDDAGSFSITIDPPTTSASDVAATIAGTINASSNARFTSVSASAVGSTVIVTGDSNDTIFHLAVRTTEHGGSHADDQTFVRAADDPVLDEGDDAHRLISYFAYDNLNQRTVSETYAADDVTLTYTGGVPNRPAATLLRSKATTDIDYRGRTFATHVFSVNPLDGTVSDSLNTNYWYDRRGHLMKQSQSGGMVSKSVYDGAGRLSKTYISDGGGDAAPGVTGNWEDADDVADDLVVTQTENQYDPAGNLIFTIKKDREDYIDSHTGELGDTASARVSYKAFFYDAANRVTTSADIGTNDGVAISRAQFTPRRNTITGTADSGSSTTLVDDALTQSAGYFLGDTLKITGGTHSGETALITGYNSSTHTITFTSLGFSISSGIGYALIPNSRVTTYTYDDAGRLSILSNPAEVESRTFYDMLARKTKVIDAYTSDSASARTDSANRTTTYTYDAASHTLSMTALMAYGATIPEETTYYLYGVLVGYGSEITSNDILASMVDPSSSGYEYYTANAQGEQTSKQDRNSTLHTYSRDALGRMTLDAITTLGNANGTVRALGYSYDDAGRPLNFTSYDSASVFTSGHVLNQVRRRYNGLGQMIKEYQSHSGEVVESGMSETPSVQYTYREMSDGSGYVNDSRLTRITYPSGHYVDYVYAGWTGYDLDNRISRVNQLEYDGSYTAFYGYIGLDTETPSSVGSDSGFDLDRFGQKKTLSWTNDTGLVTSFEYGYDIMGNLLWKKDLLHSGLDELYSYDDLNRVISYARGTLNAAHDAMTGPAALTESWSLDILGNWKSKTVNGGTPQTRDHNEQNEITSGSADYDANGNMTVDLVTDPFEYDAWNRMVRATNEYYTYDALGRRIVDYDDNTSISTDLYYSDRWQVVEETQEGDRVNSYVWSPKYVDDLVVRDNEENGLMYAEQDGNHSIVAIVPASDSDVVERYIYDPYGNVTYLEPDGDVKSTQASDYDWIYLHQGGRLDVATGQYLFRHRDFDPMLGRWMQQDPAGYVSGANIYEYVQSSPPIRVDPSGLKPAYPTPGGPGDGGGGVPPNPLLGKSCLLCFSTMTLMGFGETLTNFGPIAKAIGASMAFLCLPGFLACAECLNDLFPHDPGPPNPRGFPLDPYPTPDPKPVLPITDPNPRNPQPNPIPVAPKPYLPPIPPPIPFPAFGGGGGGGFGRQPCPCSSGGLQGLSGGDLRQLLPGYGGGSHGSLPIAE